MIVVRERRFQNPVKHLRVFCEIRVDGIWQQPGIFQSIGCFLE